LRVEWARLEEPVGCKGRTAKAWAEPVPWARERAEARRKKPPSTAAVSPRGEPARAEQALGLLSWAGRA
jgi:hypothetical protein